MSCLFEDSCSTLCCISPNLLHTYWQSKKKSSNLACCHWLSVQFLYNFLRPLHITVTLWQKLNKLCGFLHDSYEISPTVFLSQRIFNTSWLLQQKSEKILFNQLFITHKRQVQLKGELVCISEEHIFSGYTRHSLHMYK